MTDGNSPWHLTDVDYDADAGRLLPEDERLPPGGRWSLVIPVGIVVVALIGWGVWRYVHG
jgi:hypothetical protein